jgi:tRNA threonylcarbamoyladenosine biosynthesis protein TsaE
VTHLSDHIQLQAPVHRTESLPDEAATASLGGRLAACVVPGLRIYLRGELGSGKTTLARGLLRALGVREKVKSPSYTLVELYVVSRLHLYHFDFYRFIDSNEFADLGFGEYFDGEAVCLVEWPERAGAVLPLPDLDIRLSHAAEGREVHLTAHRQAGVRCLKGLSGG